MLNNEHMGNLSLTPQLPLPSLLFYLFLFIYFLSLFTSQVLLLSFVLAFASWPGIIFHFISGTQHSRWNSHKVGWFHITVHTVD